MISLSWLAGVPTEKRAKVASLAFALPFPEAANSNGHRDLTAFILYEKFKRPEPCLTIDLPRYILF